MAWRKVSQKLVKCSRALVQEFCDMKAWDGDRIFKPHLGTRIATAIEQNTFRVADFAAVTCKEDGQRYRVNGKHTGHVLASMNGTFPKDLLALVEDYECDNRIDVADLYSTFDHPAHNRSNMDIYEAFAAANPNLQNINRTMLSVAVAGMAFAIWEEAIYIHRREERANLLLGQPEFVKFVNDILKGSREKVGHVRRSPVVAAMFQTWQKSRKASAEFWSLVRDGSGPENSTADRKLHTHLLKTSVGRGRGADKSKKQEDHRAMYVRCLQAWNAWRKGEDTDLRYHANAPTPQPK